MNNPHASSPDHTSGSDSSRLPEADTSSIDRRSFLKLAGFSIAAITAGCQRAPGDGVVPHVALNPEATPGTSTWYAATCASCSAGCGVLVRTRDNRPVKIEGNPEHPLSTGGLCAAGQASLLGLYDHQRVVETEKHGVTISRDQFNNELAAAWQTIRATGGRVRVLSGTITSPTLQKQIDAFIRTFGDGRHVMYDTNSSSAMLDVHAEAFDVRALPQLRFDRAETIVSFDADFLGTWISPVEFAAGWKRGRDAEAGRFSWHLQLESRMSLTGSNADERLPLTTAERSALLGHLVARICSHSGDASMPVPTADNPLDHERFERLVTRLLAHRGRSLILVGSNDLDAQRLALRMNMALDNYGTTLDMATPSLQKQGNDLALHDLVEEMKRGEVDALVTLDVNPLYDLPDAWDVPAHMKGVGLTVAFSAMHDETTRAAQYLCPIPHALEDWSDAEPVRGLFCLSQPAIPPREGMRSVLEQLSYWTGKHTTSFDAIRSYWGEEVLPHTGGGDNAMLWKKAVRTAVVALPRDASHLPAYRVPALSVVPVSASTSGAALELTLHAAVALIDGKHGGNAWLLELPDPITKVSWDNVAAVSPRTAARLQLSNGDIVRISAEGADNAGTLAIPVLVQEGQAENTLAVALGYGGVETKRFARVGPRWTFDKPSVGANGRVGVRGNALLEMSGGGLRCDGRHVSLEKTGTKVDLALAQEYQYLAVPGEAGDGSGIERPCVREVSLAALTTGAAGHKTSEGHGAHEGKTSMWPGHRYDGHHWGMTIDLAACTGCSACVVGCQVENNIPVVGKDEVRRNREMHWLRIDRYYIKGDDETTRVAHQPMLCHHCDNAPCETVCPVLATMHSEEGLNQQVYNRCVGTRYCANNCPYKVRHFNWFDYPQDDAVANLALNPDVTVRSRGVMEKCSFCVQRIEEGRIHAKSENRELADGDILPACMQSCPTQAIRFGDVNDEGSAVADGMKNPRQYKALEELGILPSVGYLMRVRNDLPENMKEHGDG